MMQRLMIGWRGLGWTVVLMAWGALWWPAAAGAQELADTVERVTPSVVGVGTWQATRSPRADLRGSGFVVGDGRHVVTNHHVIPPILDTENREHLAVFVPGGGEQEVEMRKARRVALDERRDLALLRIEGDPLPALRIGESGRLRPGNEVALTGFPIGAVLGLVPATHVGIVSAVTPIALPMRSTDNLDPALIRRLRDPFDVFQLDLTAYPGNSGGPLFRPGDPRVIGVLNMVFVKEGRERALDRPSGISYAIPGDHVRDLMRQVDLSP
ncbi:MAG: S1C family serine protease [Ectothiorhodospira sp.]